MLALTLHQPVASVMGPPPWKDEDAVRLVASTVERMGTDPIRMEESRWYLGPVGWLLVDHRPTRQADPCRGAQGVWRVPADVYDQLPMEAR